MDEGERLQTLENKLEVREMTPEHLEQYNDLLRYAFQVTQKSLLEIGWESDDIRQSKFPILEKAYVLGCFDGEKLASQFAVYPIKMNVHGYIYEIGFITGVATYPEYSGLGLMSRLMKKSLEHMRKRGQSLSLLYPFSIPLYRHRGWELVSDKLTFRVKDSQLPGEIDAPGPVRRVNQDDEDLLKLHDRFARQTHGCILRNELAWEEYWRWDTDDVSIAIYYTKDEKPTGYMVYMIREDVMHIKEMIHLNAEAWRGLWRFISAHESMVTEVQGDNYSSEPIAFWLEDSDIKETIRPYLMGRIVDVKQFMAKYHFVDIKQEESICFKVSDPFLEWNNVSVTVEFSKDEEPKISDRKARRVVEMDIGTFTAMLLGYKRPTYLNRVERMDASPRTLALLESVIPKEKPYISDYI